jgi:glutaredoxin-like protein
MGLLEEKDKQFLKEKFSKELEKKVKIVFFSNELNCQYCKEIKMLLDEVKELDEKIEVTEFNFHNSKDEAAKYGIEDSPVIVMLKEDDSDTGIRFYGIPSGYEFSTFIEDIVMISTGKHQLSDKAVEEINKIEKPVEIKVFVTPTCPYCPKAVFLAHQLAYINKNITGKMVESMEYQDLAQKYNVYGVPKSIVNDTVEFEGAVPEKVYVKHVLEAAK